jgi:hypothetical protein
MCNVQTQLFCVYIKQCLLLSHGPPRSQTSPISNAVREGAVDLRILLVGGAYLGERVRISRIEQSCM